MNSEIILSLPYTAISVSILARFIFMYLLYRNKSKNNYSLIFCILNIGSSGMWLSYSVLTNDDPMVYRSIIEIFLLLLSASYITYNKYKDRIQIHPQIPS